MTFEQLIVQQRPHTEQVIRDLARRHYLAPAEIEDFRATVTRALERNDFELLRAFDGRSTWETYLTSVITREFFLFQGVLFGQWRPTATANRLGPAAVLLEELVIRDHLSVEEAFDVMRGAHHVDLPRYRLQQMAHQLRLTAPAGRTEDVEEAADRGAPHEVAPDAALRRALSLLSADDRLIIELRYRDHQPLSRIAKVLRIDVRPLQRRIESAKNVIRASLVEQGLDRHDVDRLLSHDDGDLVHTRHKWWYDMRSGPSQ